MPDTVEPASSTNFAIVGVGASSGGLEAFGQLLQHMGDGDGAQLAFVLIQHLDPVHESTLSEALSARTTRPVRNAEQSLRVAPGHVYVITPNTELTIQDGVLLVAPRPHPANAAAQHLPVDVFMRSLAADRGSRAIGVVLSGSASDGTEGLRAIRAEGGITFAQDPRSARFPGMPQSAVDADIVDYCLEIPQLATELLRISGHPYVQSAEPEPEPEERDADVRQQILARVREATGTDFSEFKQATVSRRLARRVALRGVANLRAYLALLDTSLDEVRALRADVLIHVTSFFRDAEAYESLRTQVFPEILKHKAEGAAIRVWVAGCSSGEEVYSLAIALLEFMGDSQPAHPLQIFGSDISETAIQAARAGVYGEHAMRSVSEERRKRYFSLHEGGHRIHKRVRDLCVFVCHDLLRDPPFSKLDLLSCRNVLIYFDRVLQQRVFPIFHYCLSQPGFLLLGRSESVVGFERLFLEVDKAKKIFQRSASVSNLRFAPRAAESAQLSRVVGRERGNLFQDYSALLARQLDHLLLARYCPAGVLVKENMDVLLFRGQTGAYLQAAPGQPQTNLIGMARDGLIAVLRETIAEAKQEQVVVRRSNVEVDQRNSTKICDVVVIPFNGPPESKQSLFVVLFEEPEAQVVHSKSERAPIDTTAVERRAARLEHELQATKEYLHVLIEEHGRTTDELGTSNEELVSGNEELQSMNEELETAKEELQSTNEELTTLNDELQRRNLEVTEVNADLMHFSMAVDIAILRFDMERRIRRFTPKARSIFKLASSDLGRGLDEIVHNLALPDLSQQIMAVIASRAVREFEVQDLQGHWYRMHIRPYTTVDEQVEGAVVSLVDIDDLKRSIADAQEARAQAERANAVKDEFLATLSHELRTPLSSMLLNAQRLRRGYVEDRAGLQRAGDALERAVHLQVKLISDLLDVSRIVAGKLTLECRALDLGELIGTTLESLRPLLEAKQLVLNQSLSPAIKPIWADPTRTQQVIGNLLSNAIKFTPRHGQISLVVDTIPGYARIRLTDTGIGIAPEFLPHVFAHFSQSDRSITRVYGGLGLGLALVRHLVELQGGSVGAHSPGVDRGATFTVTLPHARSSDAAEPNEPPAPAARSLDRAGKVKQYLALDGLRILFIDDDFRTREAVLEVLQFTGARVALAASAADGVMALDAFQPQVIICDIAMPGEDGYAFIRKLRAYEASRHVPSTPVLALTALASLDDKQRALAAGFQLHLAKPIDIDRLRDAVLKLVELRDQPSAVNNSPSDP